MQFKFLGLGIVFLWFMGGGIGHFVMTDFFVSIMPPYLPMHHEAVYISGVFEILGALGLLAVSTRRLAGWGLILLTLCVTPVNIYMWMNPQLFPDIPEAFLTIRLFIQVVLLWTIWWSTRPSCEAA